MIVVGGVYSEYCYHPQWHQIFGSGGRGAAVLTRLGANKVELVTCISEQAKKGALATLIPYGIDVHIVSSPDLYEFTYTHPLSEPFISPHPPKAAMFDSAICGDVVLAYGMLEGLPKIKAKKVIYDPQSEAEPLLPSHFIEAVEIVLVLNQREWENISKTKDFLSSAHDSVISQNYSAIVIKQGPFGCTVVDQTGTYSVPVFPSASVFKIGSGDVFSASFAKFWAIDQMSPLQAAQNASRCTSLYCNSRDIDSIISFNEFEKVTRERRRNPHVYLAGPFFSLSQRFLVEEARSALLGLGAEVFSPMHEVGFDLPPDVIAKEDLKGLENCSVVLALIADLDPGTIFEIGYARARNIPVVAYGEGIKEEHLTMLVGSDCVYSKDFCSALYNAIWAGM